MTHTTSCLVVAVFGAMLGTLGCEPEGTMIADASLDGGVPVVPDASTDSGPSPSCEEDASAFQGVDADVGTGALPVVMWAGGCAALLPPPTNEIPWSYGLGAGLPGAFVDGRDGGVFATLARDARGPLIVSFAFSTSRAPFLCFNARGTLTIAGLAPVPFSLQGLYHFSPDDPIWMLVPVGEALAAINLDGRAFTLEVTVQVGPDFASTTLCGVIDDPRS